MAISVFGNNTQTATVTTEHTLAAINAPGEYCLHVDLNAMAAGDVVELRVYEMLLASGTKRLREQMNYYGARPPYDVVSESPWIAHDLTDATSLEFSLKQTFGTGRNFPWKVLNRQGPVTLNTVQGIRKNVAQKIPFQLYDAAGVLKTGVTVTAQRAINGATSWSTCTGSVVEMLGGSYYLDAASGDVNGDSVVFRMTGSGAVELQFVVFPVAA